jgi:hypothetical protein
MAGRLTQVDLQAEINRVREENKRKSEERNKAREKGPFSAILRIKAEKKSK